MSKYEPLQHYLKMQSDNEVPMRFQDVEQLLGKKLPASAYCHRSWWANEAPGHVHAKAWLSAGYATGQVNMEERTLVFKKMCGSRAVAGKHEGARGLDHEMARTDRHPLIGLMKDMFAIEQGYDLAQSAMPAWADLIDDKYGKRIERE